MEAELGKLFDIVPGRWDNELVSFGAEAGYKHWGPFLKTARAELALAVPPTKSGRRTPHFTLPGGKPVAFDAVNARNALRARAKALLKAAKQQQVRQITHARVPAAGRGTAARAPAKALLLKATKQFKSVSHICKRKTPTSPKPLKAGGGCR